MTGSINFGSSLITGYPGQVYDEQPHKIVSKFIEAGSIEAGDAVSRGSTDPTKIAKGGAAGVAFGVAVRDQVEGESVSQATGDNIRYNSNNGSIVPVMVEGWIWVKIYSGTGVPGDPVAYNDTTGQFILGTPGIGESGFSKAILESVVTGGDQMALIHLLGNNN